MSDSKKKDNKMKVEYHNIEQAMPDVDPFEEVPDKVEKRSRRVLSHEPIVYKESAWTRFRTTMFGRDGVFGYLGSEIIMPAIRNIIVDSVSSGINMLVFQDERRGRGGRKTYDNRPPFDGGYRTRSYVNYSSRYSPSGGYYDNTDRSVRSSNRVELFTIRDRREALQILDEMLEDAKTYEYVRVSDYYDLIGHKPVYTDHNFGWDEEAIARTTIQPVNGGYIINFPRPEAIR